MDDLADDELPQVAPVRRWALAAHASATIMAPIVSIACAIVAGYFTYAAAHMNPPGDISSLAVSILRSKDAPPEMRTWARGALGISSDIPMQVGTIKPAPK
jgi:hypothetical protein